MQLGDCSFSLLLAERGARCLIFLRRLLHETDGFGEVGRRASGEVAEVRPQEEQRKEKSLILHQLPIARLWWLLCYKVKGRLLILVYF